MDDSMHVKMAFFYRTVVFLPWIAASQSTSGPTASVDTTTVSAIINSQWPRIEAPRPEPVASERKATMQLQRESFDRAFAAIKRNWISDPVTRADELRFRVNEYEEAVGTVMNAAGYGNLVLADCLRRSTLGLLVRYLVNYPGDHGTVTAVLRRVRVRLVDSPALNEVITTELNISPRFGNWAVWEDPAELVRVLSAGGSSSRDEFGRMLSGAGAPSRLIGRTDVKALLIRLLEDDILGEVILPNAVEFIRRGGSFNDTEGFTKRMADREKELKLPTGKTMGGAEIDAMLHLAAAIEDPSSSFRVLIGN